MNITVPDYILTAVLADAQALEQDKTSEKIYVSKMGHRILVYTYWNDGNKVFNMEWEGAD